MIGRKKLPNVKNKNIPIKIQKLLTLTLKHSMICLFLSNLLLHAKITHHITKSIVIDFSNWYVIYDLCYVIFVYTILYIVDNYGEKHPKLWITLQKIQLYKLFYTFKITKISQFLAKLSKKTFSIDTN